MMLCFPVHMAKDEWLLIVIFTTEINSMSLDVSIEKQLLYIAYKKR